MRTYFFFIFLIVVVFAYMYWQQCVLNRIETKFGTNSYEYLSALKEV
jgi:hypothetical protein